MALDSSPLARDFAWLGQVIEGSIHAHFHDLAPERAEAPRFAEGNPDPYALFLARHALDDDERLILLLALAPDLRPHLLDPFLIRNGNTDRAFSEFGGLGGADGGFQPSVGTALFLLAGCDPDGRLKALRRFDPEAPLYRAGLLAGLERPGAKGALLPSPRLMRELMSGVSGPPAFGAAFPARLVETGLSWDDLVLPQRCLAEIETILAWIELGPAILARPTGARFFAPGFRALFTGPSGVGKTLTAALLGRRCGRPVYRIDLSLVVSKWIGETEKNLATLFDLAQGQGWILFFDEADALFGKRTETGDAHDRYANQEVAYLLQRIEAFDGLAILATNLKRNIDSAFIRRFQAVVRFEAPGAGERARLWRQALSEPGLADPNLNVEALARDYETTGAVIVNALRRAMIAAARGSGKPIDEALLRAAVERELIETGGDRLR